MEICLNTNISVRYSWNIYCKVFWVAALRGNWISYINLIPRSFWVWQKRILFWSQAVYVFHYTKWCNEVKKKKQNRMDLCNFQFDMFSFGKLETCETHLAKILWTAGKSLNPRRIYQIFLVLLTLLDYFKTSLVRTNDTYIQKFELLDGIKNAPTYPWCNWWWSGARL